MGAIVSGNPVLHLDVSNGFPAFDFDNCQKQGLKYHGQYVENSPFPHIVLDDFLDADILRRVLDEFPQREAGRFSDSFSQLKTGYKLDQIRSAYTHSLLNALNSAHFLTFLESLTGITGLIDDARYAGGGLHETARGGHLSIHADFNIHPSNHLHRRLNLILFLNEDWDPSYGGALELWDRNMQACQKSVVPMLGRAVIFNTDTTSYHGHPDPLTCPENVYRRSIALYYYTARPYGKLAMHSTLFQHRPGSQDATPSIKERLREQFNKLLFRVQ